jgi:hypothetical protein
VAIPSGDGVGDRCPLDTPTVKNLLFLIGLRNEITHHMSPTLDHFVSARYQACCLNYNRYIKELFGPKHGIDQFLGYSLQFQAISRDQLVAPNGGDLPPNVRSYIARFDSEMSAHDLNSVRRDGFHWGDAGVGAAAAFAIVAIAAGVALAIRDRRDRPSAQDTS